MLTAGQGRRCGITTRVATRLRHLAEDGEVGEPKA
jgi:hypothetical protein